MPKGIDASLLRRLPPKWAAVIVIGLIGYACLQPIANRQFGLSLPGIGALSGDSDAASTSAKANSSSANIDTDRDTDRGSDSLSDDRQLSSSASSSSSDKTSGILADSGGNKAKSQSGAASGQMPAQSVTENPESPGADTRSSSTSEDLLYGFLKEIRSDVYQSPAGIVYGPGSEEGHRLLHLGKHLEDIPDRPGKHGVFDGGIEVALKVIDDAYVRAKKGSRGTRKFDENGRTRYEVTFDKPIGFVGGRDGGRSKNPAAKQLRIIVEGNKFVTAFPF